jgi:alanine-glyoxylate transaminase/serine-glyoxylate transaminase/serine-pyruvate transaminase
MFPANVDAEQLRKLALEEFDLVLGVGLGPLRGRAIRIGHLGSLNDPMLLGTLAALELGLRKLEIVSGGGVEAALERALMAPTGAAID